MKVRDFMRDFEWHLLGLAFGVALIGIAFVWSATRDSLHFGDKALFQAGFAFVSAPLLLAILRIGYASIGRWAYLFYGAGIALLALLLAGLGGGPARRWFDLGFGIRMQPSELMKLAFVLALARYLMYRRDWERWSSLAVPFAMALVPMALIAVQPDLGTALLFLPVLFAMLFAAGARVKHLAALVVAGAILVPLAYHSPLLREYQKERVASFLLRIPALEQEARQLYQDGKKEEARAIEQRVRDLKRGAGYQQFFSQVAIGSGGLLGAGLCAGMQNRLKILPESHTDFIFAIVGEEWGFLGCCAVLVLFLLMVAIILGVARRTREPFGKYLCCGVGAMIATQVFVNASVAVALLPIAGLTLPFVSYGGSSLLTSMAAVGLVLDVGVRRIHVFGR